jgi:hypothetical protein
MLACCCRYYRRKEPFPFCLGAILLFLVNDGFWVVSRMSSSSLGRSSPLLWVVVRYAFIHGLLPLVSSISPAHELLDAPKTHGLTSAAGFFLFCSLIISDHAVNVEIRIYLSLLCLAFCVGIV